MADKPNTIPFKTHGKFIQIQMAAIGSGRQLMMFALDEDGTVYEAQRVNYQEWRWEPLKEVDEAKFQAEQEFLLTYKGH